MSSGRILYFKSDVLQFKLEFIKLLKSKLINCTKKVRGCLFGAPSLNIIALLTLSNTDGHHEFDLYMFRAGVKPAFGAFASVSDSCCVPFERFRFIYLLPIFRHSCFCSVFLLLLFRSIFCSLYASLVFIFLVG